MLEGRETARVQLASWHEVSRWLAYAAAEFAPDATTSEYLDHVAVTVRDEGERRFAEAAGFTPSLAQA